MAHDSGSPSGAGSRRAYGPPVFTQWSEGSAARPAVEGRATPPYVADPPAREGTPATAAATAEHEFGRGAAAAPESPPDDAFPVDAFIVPEGLDFDPQTGSTAQTPAAAAAPVADPATVLAERLERLAARLRAEGASALAPGHAGNDRLDSLLTGMLAGYLAGRHG